ncbi:MAG: hypothetical protein AB7H71_18470 [Alphaproteobacteria bacterium]
MSEAYIQALVHDYPACLPIAEIDAMFSGPVPICTELNTPAGSIDNFMVTPSGLPVLVECKLWRNPEARREVVSQILDYAKELSRWSSSDVQREVKHRLKRDGNPLLDMVRSVDPQLDERQFNDSLTANLRRGRFLLLIVGDGIREGVEAITEYLQLHAGLHFSLGLVELPVYVMPNGDRLVAPRVLARTALITRNVVAVPDGYVLDEVEDPNSAVEVDPERAALGEQSKRFWTEFIDYYLKLDDPEQPKPRPARQGYISLSLPARTSWLTVYRILHPGEVGIFMSCWRNTPGDYARQAIVDEFKAGGALKDELGGTARPFRVAGDSRDSIIDSLQVGSLEQPELRKKAFCWLAERANTFVRVLRPRMRSAAADYQSKGE